MKKLNRKILKIVERATRSQVKKNEDSIFCLGFFHQPVRPYKKDSEEK